MFGIGKSKKKVRSNRRKAKREIFEAVVPTSLVEQAEAFTAPRGHMEMGGLLIGHVDEKGRNVCAVGVFPKQIAETSSYCEFDGGWMAICAAAADYANTQIESEDTPNIRVIGWIHTHPGLGLFLSSIDIKTYEDNLNMTKDGRFVAVVVDPLEGNNGVFLTPDKPRSFFSASGSIQMDDELKAKYLTFLQRMEEIRGARGREALPFILCGDLRAEHVSKGNTDDFVESYLKGIHGIRKELKRLTEDSENGTHMINRLEDSIDRNEQRLNENISSIEDLHKETESKILEIYARIDGLQKELVEMSQGLTDSLEERIAEAMEDFANKKIGVDVSDEGDDETVSRDKENLEWCWAVLMC